MAGRLYLWRQEGRGQVIYLRNPLENGDILPKVKRCLEKLFGQLRPLERKAMDNWFKPVVNL
jgi:hypothetical protein